MGKSFTKAERKEKQTNGSNRGFKGQQPKQRFLFINDRLPKEERKKVA